MNSRVAGVRLKPLSVLSSAPVSAESASGLLVGFHARAIDLPLARRPSRLACVRGDRTTTALLSRCGQVRTRSHGSAILSFSGSRSPAAAAASRPRVNRAFVAALGGLGVGSGLERRPCCVVSRIEESNGHTHWMEPWRPLLPLEVLECPSLMLSSRLATAPPDNARRSLQTGQPASGRWLGPAIGKASSTLSPR